MYCDYSNVGLEMLELYCFRSKVFEEFCVCAILDGVILEVDDVEEETVRL